MILYILVLNFLSPSIMDCNVIYAAVVHWEKSEFRIVADFSIEDPSAFREITLEVMGSTITTDEERISIQRGKYTVHLLIAELRYVAVTLTPDGPIFSAKVASSSQIFLNRLRWVYRELPILADLSSDFDGFSVIDLSSPLKKVMEEFNSSEVDATSKIKENLTEIRRVLMENAQKLIDRDQKLDELLSKTQTLEITSRRDFRRASKTSKAARKKKKIVIIVILTVIMGMAMIGSTMAICYYYL